MELLEDKNKKMKKINLKEIFPAILIGVVSGIIVFYTQVFVGKFNSPLFNYLNLSGTIFGVISGAYFIYLCKENFSIKFVKYILWIIFSFSSFFLAIFAMIASGGVGSASLMMGFSGFAGILILIIGFRILFSRLQHEDYIYLIVVAILIPAIISPFLDSGTKYQSFSYFALYTIWQTSVLVLFTRVLIRTKSTHKTLQEIKEEI